LSDNKHNNDDLITRQAGDEKTSHLRAMKLIKFNSDGMKGLLIPQSGIEQIAFLDRIIG